MLMVVVTCCSTYSKAVSSILVYLHLQWAFLRQVCIFRLCCSYTYIDTAYEVVWSVSQSVTTVSPAETVEPIEMPFGLWIPVGPRNHVLDWVQIPRAKEQF